MDGPRIEQMWARAYRVPTDLPEADGTFAWDATTIVVVGVQASERTGIGYSYTDAAAVPLVLGTLRPLVIGRDATGTPEAWDAMVRAVRNIGRSGLAACAISAVDCALWDLKCRVLEVPLATLLGDARDRVVAYASGGFTSYPVATLESRLAAWIEEGFGLIKMKIGTSPAEDSTRVGHARRAIGPGVALFVDANGAYAPTQALAVAEMLSAHDVTWFEEPVSSDDVAGLRLMRERAPRGMDIAAGEYGYDPFHFRRLLEAGAVDVLQADATRCGGITGFLRAAALADAFGVPISAHCATALHLHPCCAIPRLRHVEWFHDHVRIEQMLFDGSPVQSQGTLAPDLSRPGLGLELKENEARRYATT